MSRAITGWPCQLLRGGVPLGVVTHDAVEDAGPCEVGWLEPTGSFETVRDLFATEFRIVAELCRAESGSQFADALTARLAETQCDIITPGVRLIRLDNEQIIEVDELHVEELPDGLKVFWR